MSSESIASNTFLKLFELVDYLQQKGLATSARENITMLESMTVRQQKSVFAVITMTQRKPEGVNLKDLAQRLNMTVPATSVLVEAMVKKKLFVRVTSPYDRRAICIKISKEGEKIFEVIIRQTKLTTHDMISVLTDEEKKQFAEIIEKLYGTIF